MLGPQPSAVPSTTPSVPTMKTRDNEQTERSDKGMSPDPSTHALKREGRAPVVAVGRFSAKDFGSLWLAWSEAGLVEVSFAPFDWLDTVGVPSLAIPKVYAEPLKAYFNGEDAQLHTLPRDARGTPFQHQVWDELCRIPRGSVRSYSGVALDIGNPRATRAVGLANGRNPLPVVVPCHRVVAASHQLGGYTGGLDRKRALLELEGVHIEGDVVRPGQLTLFEG